jgi:hypothetical protein
LRDQCAALARAREATAAGICEAEAGGEREEQRTVQRGGGRSTKTRKHWACARRSPRRIYRTTMRGAQTIWRVAVCFSLLCLLAGCDTRRHPPHGRPPHSAQSGAPASEAAPSAAASLLPPIAEALQEVHEQKLEILPPRDETPRLAFGKGRLAQAMNDKVVYRDTKDGSVVAESAFGAVRALTAGVDGSLIALGLSGGARLEPHSTKVRAFAHVTFFPGAALFADLEDASHFYVYYAGEEQLFHYGFEAEAGSFLPIEDRFPLAGCVGAPALTRDGAFLCNTADGIERRAPRGREARFKLPPGVSAAVRLLPAKRLDAFSCPRCRSRPRPTPMRWLSSW